ncbi:hypothetical protein BVRB_032330, partial [Beta vulgaris subsp. vulgaris]
EEQRALAEKQRRIDQEKASLRAALAALPASGGVGNHVSPAATSGSTRAPDGRRLLLDRRPNAELIVRDPSGPATSDRR